MPELVIKGGTIVDRSGERRADVAIDDGKIVAVGEDLSADRTLDATDAYVSPGFVDLHAHLREPGNEAAETIETGSRAGVLGGFSALVAMPNTTPTIDSASVVKDVLALGSESLIDLYTSASITIGRGGDSLSPMAELAELGVRIFTDDGNGVQDEAIMRTALEYAGGLGVTLAQHCEVEALSAGGYMHEGEWSSRLGIGGQPAEAEELMVMRDIALCRLTGTRMHFQHLSTAGSVEMVRQAKAAGLPVTAEATTHHFTLDHSACADYDTVFKVHPPLRTAEDVVGVKAGLADGTIDAIATDHAPHTPETKDKPFDAAPPGMLGLETALALALTELDLSVGEVVSIMSMQPAEIAGIDDTHGRDFEVGAPANIAVFDPAAEWVVEATELASLSRNTPYAGRKLVGKVRHTVVNGEAVVIDEAAQR